MYRIEAKRLADEIKETGSYIGDVPETDEEDDPYFYYNHEKRMISETLKENLEYIENNTLR